MIAIDTLTNRIERFWHMELPSGISNIDFIKYSKEKKLVSTQKDAVIKGYSIACEKNDTTLMSFYEEIFSFCRIDLKSFMSDNKLPVLKRTLSYTQNAADDSYARKSTRLDLSHFLESNGMFKPQKDGNTISTNSYFSLKK